MKFNGLFAGFLTFAGASVLNFYTIPWMLSLVATSAVQNDVIIVTCYVFIGVYFIFSNMLAPIMVAREDSTD